jgi:hypothetical protein
MFRAGDRVLLRRRQPGKMKTRAEGPFTFKGYKTTEGWVALVENMGGRLLEVAAANLIALKGMQQLPTLGPEVVYEDLQPEEQPAPKRKRGRPPATSAPVTAQQEPAQLEQTMPPPHVPFWENPLFQRLPPAHPHDFSSSGSDDEDMGSLPSDGEDPDFDPAGMLAAAMRLPRFHPHVQHPTHKPATTGPGEPTPGKVQVLRRMPR